MTGAHASQPLARRSAVGWGAVALGLVAIVAMAAHGAAWSDHGGGEVRSLPRVITFAGAVVAGGVAVMLLLLVLIHAGAPETPEQRRRRWSTAIGFLVLVAMISLIRVVNPSHRTPPRDSPPASVNGSSPRAAGRHDPTSATWWPLVIVGLGTALAVVAATARRGEARSPAHADTDDATIALLDASLDDLRREPDARRAVVAAYARMEGGLAAHGFARQPSETPSEYLRRALTTGAGGPPDVPPAALRPRVVEALGELTAIAERARFSLLPIDETIRARAIEALEKLRGELRRELESRADLGRVV